MVQSVRINTQDIHLKEASSVETILLVWVSADNLLKVLLSIQEDSQKTGFPSSRLRARLDARLLWNDGATTWIRLYPPQAGLPQSSHHHLTGEVRECHRHKLLWMVSLGRARTREEGGELRGRTVSEIRNLAVEVRMEEEENLGGAAET